MRKIDCIIVHHTATPSTATIESIRNYHVNVRGWRDIGYHYLIQRDGVIRLGRPEEIIGAHCSGHNAVSIGVAVIGNFEEAISNGEVAAQMRALECLLGDLVFRYPGACVVPHRKLAATLCPGRYLVGWLDERWQ